MLTDFITPTHTDGHGQAALDVIILNENLPSRRKKQIVADATKAIGKMASLFNTSRVKVQTLPSFCPFLLSDL